MTRRWSIARRLTLWCTLATGGLGLAVAALGAGFLSRAVEAEIDALVVEELHELQLAWPTTDRSREQFGVLVDSFGRQHPANPMSWRVLELEGGARWGDFGAPELLAALPDEWTPRDETREPALGLRTRTAVVEPGLLVELAVDGSEQRRLLARYGRYALVLGGFATLAALIAGALLGRRIGAMLARVAEAACEVPPAAERVALDVRPLPEEIRQIVEALSDAFARVERDKERTRMLSAGLAHELRAPLQNLLGEAEVTLLRERAPAEYVRALESQLEELRDLTRVVDNLVLLCTPREGAAPAVERFDLAEEVTLRLGKERAAAERRGVRITETSSGGTELSGDREALVLALRNLVSNAVEWSPDDGTVQLAIQGNGTELTMTVDDDGPGVPVGEREKIFTPFHSGPARAGRRAGYGLGLALTRAAVEAHGGTIAVGTSPLGGARFSVALPRREGPPGERDRGAS